MIKIKPIVHYIINEHNRIKLARRAVLQPIDHPSSLVSNTKLVLTSKVIMHNKDSGEFETENTIYRPRVDN